MALLTLNLFILTWNVAQQDPCGLYPGTILNLPPPPGTPYPDIYAIGLQEMSHLDRDWETAFDEIMTQNSYKKLASDRVQGKYSGIMIQVFALTSKLAYIKLDEAVSIATGAPGRNLGTKGASTARLRLNNVPVCFVASHLVAHDNQYNQRIEQMRTINTGVNYKSQPTNPLDHKLVFWFGDLNFRLDASLGLTSAQIIDGIKKQNYGDYLRYDEIRMVMARWEFNEFKEVEINFPPTFKFKKGSSEYTAERRPAWTDRILYREDQSTVTVTPKKYTSLGGVVLSDHRPVIGVYDIQINN